MSGSSQSQLSIINIEFDIMSIFVYRESIKSTVVMMWMYGAKLTLMFTVLMYSLP